MSTNKLVWVLVLLAASIQVVRGLLVVPVPHPKVTSSLRRRRKTSAWRRRPSISFYKNHWISSSSSTSFQCLPVATQEESSSGRLFHALRLGILNSHGARRLATVAAVIVGSFFAYLAGTALLNRTIVARFGVSRGGDAFGPFATLLSLIYSIVLGQIYHYYFERQQAIQNCLYQEAAALQLLFHACRPHGIAPLKAYTQSFLQTAFGNAASSRILHHDPAGKLIALVVAGDDNNDDSLKIVVAAIQSATSARALRISHVNSELPAVQSMTARLLSHVILGGFVLVDLKAPILEALLFAVISGCFATIHGWFLVDLSDPFSGQWMVGTHIRKDLEDLISAMEDDHDDDDTNNEVD